jgi:hypothetical protein
MSDKPGTLELIGRHLTLALRPLLDGLSDLTHFKQLMYRLGWKVTDLPPEYAALASAVNTAVTKFETLSDNPSPDDVAGLLQAVKGAYEAIQGISTAPPGVDDGPFLAEIVERLFELLLIDYLVLEVPTLYRFLSMTNVIRFEQQSATAGRPSYVRVHFDWSQIPNILSSPQELPAIVYGWGTPDLNVQRIVDHLAELFFALGLPVTLEVPDENLAVRYAELAGDSGSIIAKTLVVPFYTGSVANKELEAAFALRHLPPAGAKPAGLIIEPQIPQEFPLTLQLTDTINLRLIAGTNAGSLFGILIRPDGISIKYPFEPGTTPPQAGIGIGMDFKPATTTILVGDQGATRLELQSASIDLGVKTVDGDFELELRGTLTGLALVLTAGEGDGFLQKILGSGETRVNAPVSIEWSSRLGLSFGGNDAFEVDFHPHLNLGPISIDDLSVQLGVPSPRPPDIVLGIGAGITARLGPLQAVVQGIGLQLETTFNSGNVGPFDLGLGFKPPNGIGLEIDAGEVQGGGFLYFDPPHGQYAGALQLEIADFLSVSAIGLLSTKMPDGTSGFSLLIILTADFGAGIQLSFGFTLLAVGGLLGLNRTVLIQPLIDGVRTGSIQSIMFPHDVIANAPRIISDLRAIFPAQEGIFLIGPMAKIGWGEPTLISLSLGVIIQIPPGDAAILGVLRVALPADDVAVLVLQVNFAGVLEFDKQRFYFFASLFDSHILFITITGQMGVLFAYGDDANFVLSVGGFHPQFNPPPLPFPAPQRISLDLINESYARIHADGYFAVTTNTVQFGTHSDFFFGFSACSVSGSAGFDALIQFSPFHFTAEISSQFSVKVFGMGVYGVGIDVTLDGPTPWHAHGTASLSFFFFSIDIGIDVTWGDDPNTTLPPIAVMPLLVAEAQKASNWRTALPANTKLLVALRQLDPSEAGFILHPAGTLQISQRTVPLDLKIDKLGSQPPSDADQFAFSVSSSVLVKTRDLQEPFAPSQFRNFDDATKLSQPAFVPQDSGIELAGAAALTSGTAITRPVRFDLTIVDAKSVPARNKFFQHSKAMFTNFLAGNSAGQSPLSANIRGLTRPNDGSVVVANETFAVALQSSNKGFHPDGSVFLSQAKAQDFIAQAVAADPSLEGTLHVIPQFEMAT